MIEAKDISRLTRTPIYVGDVPMAIVVSGTTRGEYSRLMTAPDLMTTSPGVPRVHPNCKSAHGNSFILGRRRTVWRMTPELISLTISCPATRERCKELTTSTMRLYCVKEIL